MVIVKFFLVLLSELGYCDLKIRLLLKPENEAFRPSQGCALGFISAQWLLKGLTSVFAVGSRLVGRGIDCLMLLEFNHVVTGIL